MSRQRLHVFISGLVQGVFFRASTRETAVDLGLTGWVRNLPDGRVEALFEGDRESLDRILEWCRRGPPGSRPDDVLTRWEERAGELEGFRIVY